MIRLRRPRARELRTVWEVAAGEKVSRLVGTAHFIPWSFRSSLEGLLEDSRVVLLEGPLEPEAMARVREAGAAEKGEHLFDGLSDETIRGVNTALFPGRRSSKASALFQALGRKGENPAYDLVEGMKPWLAFFTLWSSYLEGLGWKHSVDYEAYSTALEMGKLIVYLESIEEQIQVLESLSLERIHGFLERHGQWKKMAEEYAKAYADADFDGIRLLSLSFPTRRPEVIGKRDHLFHLRMKPELEQGGAVIFVGAPHIPGLLRLLEADGCEVKGPPAH